MIFVFFFPTYFTLTGSRFMHAVLKIEIISYHIPLSFRCCLLWVYSVSLIFLASIGKLK